MIGCILVPLDGSEIAEAAVPFAALIPGRHVRLLAVEPTSRRDGWRPAAGAPPLPWRSGGDMPADAYLDRVADTFRRQGRRVDLAVEQGDPGKRIIAATADADLVVMATRGRGMGPRAIFGSVAEHVARQVAVPTLLVRGTEPRAPPTIARIVVPLDGAAAAEAALPTAASLSDTLGVQVHLVQVVDAPARSSSETPLAREAEAYLAGQVARLRGRDVPVTSEVLRGPVAQTLPETIQPTDLVVMTPRDQPRVWRKLLGSVAERLVREAPAPVLIVR